LKGAFAENEARQTVSVPPSIPMLQNQIRQAGRNAVFTTGSDDEES
jgi:hypothetical protein